MKYKRPSPSGAQPLVSKILEQKTDHVEIGIMTHSGAAVESTIYAKNSLGTL